MHRRSFLAILIGALDCLIAVALLIPGLRAVMAAPRRRKGGVDFVRVAALDAIKAGKPHLSTVQAVRWDAYIKYLPGPIGRVWLIREGGPDDAPKIHCLHTICPHLGCGIDFAPDRKAFACPCHASEFSLDGKSLIGPSPRNMDELECRVTDPDESGRRWVEVRYREFQIGIPQQREV